MFMFPVGFVHIWASSTFLSLAEFQTTAVSADGSWWVFSWLMTSMHDRITEYPLLRTDKFSGGLSYGRWVNAIQVAVQAPWTLHMTDRCSKPLMSCVLWSGFLFSSGWGFFLFMVAGSLVRCEISNSLLLDHLQILFRLAKIVSPYEDTIFD